LAQIKFLKSIKFKLSASFGDFDALPQARRGIGLRPVHAKLISSEK